MNTQDYGLIDSINTEELIDKIIKQMCEAKRNIVIHDELSIDSADLDKYKEKFPLYFLLKKLDHRVSIDLDNFYILISTIHRNVSCLFNNITTDNYGNLKIINEKKFINEFKQLYGDNLDEILFKACDKKYVPMLLRFTIPYILLSE